MNKKLILTACAAATMVFATSCDKSHEVEMNHGNAISFRASTNSLLRAGNVKTIESLQTDGFKVEAFAEDKTTLLFSEKVNRKGSENIWMPENIQYWPSSGDVHFYAYAPKSAATWETGTKSFTDFTPAPLLENQVDFLVAYNKGNKTSNETSGVELHFKHALSQINIKADNASTSMTVKVKGVKIVNVSKSGKFTFPETATVESTTINQNLLALDKWSSFGQKSGYAQVRNDEVTLTALATDLISGDNRFMLVPQTLTAWKIEEKTNASNGTYIALYVQITNKAGNQMYPKNQSVKYGWTAVPVDGTWEPGKKYTYVLHFFKDGGGAGNQEPNPNVPGDNGGDTTKPGEGGGTGVNNGDPILGAPIKFTLTVDNWFDAPSSDKLDLKMK